MLVRSPENVRIDVNPLTALRSDNHVSYCGLKDVFYVGHAALVCCDLGREE